MAKIVHFFSSGLVNLEIKKNREVCPIFDYNFPLFYSVDEKNPLFVKWTSNFWRKIPFFFFGGLDIFGEKKYSMARKKALISVCLVRAITGKKALISVCLVRGGSREEDGEELEEVRRLIKAGRSHSSLCRDDLPTINQTFCSSMPRENKKD